MTCPRRNHHLLLIYCLFVLLHVQQTVNSLQNGYHRHPANTHSRNGHNPLPHKYSRKGGGGSSDSMEVDNLGHKELVLNGVREKEREHHFRHQHHRQLHRHQSEHSSNVNFIKNDELHRPHSIPPPRDSRHRFATKRIEEAVHAFQKSTTEVPVALHGHYPHHRFHQHNQPLQSHHTTHQSLRPTPSSSGHHHRSNNLHTPRPRSDNSLESQKKSLAWAANHRHQGSSVSYEFTTASPLDTRTETSSRTAPSKGSSDASGGGISRSEVPLDQMHSKHADETDDSYDDDDYYYYEEDNDNESDDTENDDEDEHVNEDMSGHSVDARKHQYETLERLEHAEPIKMAQQGLYVNSENAPYLLHASAMDYDEHNFLADEPVEGLGSLTEQKWRNYSTREGVEKMARAESPNIAAAAHLKRINQEGMCKYPHPKVVPVSNNTSKRFIPHCTILHRCGDDTGCCWSDTKTCVAKSTESVELYFYVIPMGQKRSVIEPLSLINHTECHCVDRNQVRTTTTSSLMAMTPSPDRQIGHCTKYFDLDDSDRDYVHCDCLDRNLERREACQRLSRGEEGFMPEDRICISQGRCKAPTCEYGQYNRTVGRCPRKDHKIETAKNVNQPFH